ncbi:hypothetical protein SAMN05421678_103390 [Actinopolymorpha cephalotaxi]|uniref:Phosphotransferase enzyme family protein n=1 Tax=Actinopolymorpha cephalotaxi TaxID=504797 RepID=A0A1I2NII4_9ACTN|nr:hypothetical protein [Actinopolymorpha cephalotaxi]NYH85502.1 hypothetical protein [Actinopolymorpha cephalotaxi]SFG03408.1 hypothetical protein SAMN05421678_103390 [Actinopolymorpha cephalotaxi]
MIPPSSKAAPDEPMVDQPVTDEPVIDRPGPDQAAEESLDVHLPAGIAARASALLSEHLATPVRVTGYEPLRVDGHAHVARLVLDGAPFPSAVVKVAHRGDDGEFDRAATDFWSPAHRLWNEWCGLEFLSSTPSKGGTPTFYGGDADLGFILIEDLGADHSLAHILLREGAEPARAGMAGYVDALARVHLASFDRNEEYDRLRARFGVPAKEEGIGYDVRTKLVPALADLDPGLATAIDEAALAAVDWIEETLAVPSWQAYSPNDCCPDNNHVDDDATVRLFDLEFGGFRHALLDLAYVRTVMPTCWCVRRLPEGLPDVLVGRYRQRLAEAGRDVTCPDSTDGTGTADFDAALDACAAYWALWSLAWMTPRALAAEGAERRRFDEWSFDLPSHRELFVLRLENLADAARRQPRLAALGDLADTVRATTTKAWPGVGLLPIYPAFG